jgi:parallel beta-helix repeat protein
VSLVLLGGLVPLRAATPISAPATIDKPGSYVLTRNLRSERVPALVIRADNVTIDLGGHVLATHHQVCCVVAASTVTGLRIANGAIVGERAGDVGIDAVTSPELRIENVMFDGLGTAVRATASRATTLRHNRVARGIEFGFDLAGSSGFVVEDNTIEAATGLRLDAVSSSIARNFFGGELLVAPIVLLPAARNNRVAENVVRSTGPGIVVHGSGNTIDGNVIDSLSCSLWFKPGAARNLVRANSSRPIDQGCACPRPAVGSVCDEGEANTSHGDNYLPDRM